MKRFLSIKEMAILATVFAHIVIYVVFFMAEIDDTLPEEHNEVYLAIQTEEELMQDFPEETPAERDETVDGKLISNTASSKEEEVDENNYKVTQDDINKTLKQYGADKWDKTGSDTKEEAPDENGSVNLTREQGSSSENQDKTTTPNAIKYSGKSTCEWELEGRELWKPSNPVYRCKAGGEVFINIVVTRQGKVVKAEVNPSKSSTSNECLVSQATEYVKKMVFNTNYDVATRQSGHVIYKFQIQ
jgi:outer membrane biosynthesis protein TonB